MSTATMSPPKRKTAARKNFSSPAAEHRGINAAAKVTRFPKSNFVIDSPKVFALETLSNMEEDVSWHDIFYWLKIAEDLEDSMREANEGLGSTQEEVEAEFYARWQK